MFINTRRKLNGEHRILNIVEMLLQKFKKKISNDNICPNEDPRIVTAI